MYEIFAHTADAGIRVEAPDLNSLFADAGQGLFSLIVANLGDVRPLTHKHFSLAGSEPDYLLLDWLSELLFAFDSEHLLFREFEVTVGEQGLVATAAGEPIDEGRHRLEHEVKAITYHNLSVEHTPQGWKAIVDI